MRRSPFMLESTDGPGRDGMMNEADDNIPVPRDRAKGVWADSHEESLALTSRFRLISSSAASRARRRWTSGGTRTTNLPL